MTTQRTDEHRPSAIIPEDYEYVAMEYLPWPQWQWLQANREFIRKHMARTGGTYSTHHHGGNCMVCGNVNALYTVLFYHSKTNTYVRMGTDCAEKLDMSVGQDMNAFRSRVARGLEAERGKRKAMEFLSDNGMIRAWEIYDSPDTDREDWAGRTLCDIVGKLVKWGSISEKQQGFLRSLITKYDSREQIAREREQAQAEREAARQAEHEAAAPCPSGRITVTGVVLTVKERDTQFGCVLKMLVQATDGYKVWGTVPRVIDPDRGDTVEFVATVTPSKDDTKFGFASRPSKARVVAKGAAE